MLMPVRCRLPRRRFQAKSDSVRDLIEGDIGSNVLSCTTSTGHRGVALLALVADCMGGLERKGDQLLAQKATSTLMWRHFQKLQATV